MQRRSQLPQEELVRIHDNHDADAELYRAFLMFVRGLYTGLLRFYDARSTKNPPQSYQIGINCDYQSILPLLPYARSIFLWPHLWIYRV
jgi:hypothetical protein